MNCHECGGILVDGSGEYGLPSARMVRHAGYVCECIRCGTCGDVIGNQMDNPGGAECPKC